MKELNLELYQGNGVPIDERNQVLPGYEPIKDFDHAKNYIAGQGLRQAVNVALALGQAILLTNQPGEVKNYLPENLLEKMPTRSVVLIDEIDKAPRDLPNDVLNEVEKMQFEVKETGKTFTAAESLRPILVLTSNSEKNLPDAFLRRCIFYHIPFPSHEQLTAIVEKRFAPYRDFTLQHIEAAVEMFLKIRSVDLKKRPATAEFLGWLQVLQALDLEPADIKTGKSEALALTMSILAKSREDLDTLKKFLDKTRD
jgi:MoxR-like ATPase